IQGNTIIGNAGYALYSYDYYQPSQTVVNAQSNWWGSADGTVIAGLIYDYAQNSSYSPVVDYGNWQGSQGGTAVSGTYVGGQIVSNTVWHTSDSPIGVIAPLQVVSNAVLT